MEEIIKFLENPPNKKALVIGDLMLDKYFFGSVDRISPEAPVPVVNVKKIENRIGGAGNTALNLKNLGIDVDVIGIIGEDENGYELLKLFEKNRIKTDFIIKDDRITTTKIRVVSKNQHLIRIDFENDKTIEKVLEEKILKILENAIKNYDLIIISDYNKGLISEKISEFTINKSKFTIVDPKGKNWNKYRNANIITPNVKELSEGLNETIENEDYILEKMGKLAIEKFNFESIVITRSEKGLSYIDRYRVLHVPTYESEVYDVSGAGDTVVAVLGFGILCSLEIEKILKFANFCASIVIRHIGTYPIRKEDILNAPRGT